MSFLNFFSKSQKPLAEAARDVYLIVGLGNPGREYRETRHNIGFMVVDKFAESHAIKLGKVQSKAIIGSGGFGENKIILAKPQTFMNLSGQAVVSLARFYKVQHDHIVIIHDDVDLPFASLRMRPGGGSAGQKGVASIIQLLGTQDFPRLRMGIGRPPGQMDAAAYVLQAFSRSEIEFLPPLMEKAVNAINCFLTDGLESAMNRFNPSVPE